MNYPELNDLALHGENLSVVRVQDEFERFIVTFKDAHGEALYINALDHLLLNGKSTIEIDIDHLAQLDSLLNLISADFNSHYPSDFNVNYPSICESIQLVAKRLNNNNFCMQQIYVAFLSPAIFFSPRIPKISHIASVRLGLLVSLNCQIYTPCTLLVVMSWVSFWINKEASPARVALGIMTVLSMSTLGFGLRTDLPKVSHSTALDIYILACFGFAFAAMVEYAVINYAHIVYIRKQVHDLKGLDSNRAMEKMRIFTAGLMGARRDTLQVETLTLPEDNRPWYRKLLSKSNTQQSSMFYRMAVKAARARQKLKMRDPAKVVNRIDNVSKIIFPTLYILFNIVYWLAFLYWIPDEIDEFVHIPHNSS